MANLRRRQADELIRSVLSVGATKEGSARAAGVSVRTVYRRMEDPKFQQEVEELGTDFRRRANATMSAIMPEAAKALHELLKSNDAVTKRTVARTIIEMGTRLNDKVILELRILALEERFNKSSEQQPPTDAKPGG